MAGIVSYPQVVEEAVREFGDLLPNEPQREYFAEYLTGLFVADRKNVSGINREFAQTTDQSCLNRFLTAAAWDAQRSTSCDSTSSRRSPRRATARTASSPWTTPSSTTTAP